MRGRRIKVIWQSNPALHALAKYRHACRYEAYVPLPLAGLALTLDARTAGTAPDAESAIRDLNSTAVAPALTPLARLLLRTESIASSRDAATWAIIDVLPAHPVITAPVASVATGVQRRRYIKRLVSSWTRAC